MTASSFGDHNEPKFADGDAPDLAVNPSQAAAYAAKVGNRRVGTTAERNAATGKDVWEDLEWQDTTDQITYLRKSGAWVPSGGKPTSGVVYGVGGFTTSFWVQRTAHGFVHATVNVSRAAGIPSGVAIAIMGAGFRPATQIEFAGVTSAGGVAGPAFVRIETSGNIVVFNPGASNQTLSFAVTYQGA